MNHPDRPRYTVHAFRNWRAFGSHEGSDYDCPADTLKQAKERVITYLPQ